MDICQNCGHDASGHFTVESFLWKEKRIHFKKKSPCHISDDGWVCGCKRFALALWADSEEQARGYFNG